MSYWASRYSGATAARTPPSREASGRPDRVVAESGAAGVLYGTVDLDRLAYLRRTDEELSVPKKYRSIPGLLRAVRPEIVEGLQQAFSQREGGG